MVSPAANKPTLRVLTYSGFAGKHSAGEAAKELFEKTRQCVVDFRLVENSLAILADLKLSQGKGDSDLILGLDGYNLVDAMAYTEGLAPAEIKSISANLSEKIHGNFLPVDYSYLTFIVDTQKIKKIPGTWREFLLAKNLRKQLILQDPRSSSPGLGLLLSLQSVFKQDLPLQLAKLKEQTLTVGKGWSETYGLFTRGESGMVWSYTTSESYHRERENSKRYKAIYFEEGLLKQVEYAAVLKQAKNKTLALGFLKFLVSPPAQKLIAEKNWMLPVNPDARPLITTKALLEQMEPATILKVSDENLTQLGKSKLVEAWLKIF